mgnify:CR=1 FL=1
MKITVICVGKLKEEYLKSAVLEYEKRLSRYADIKTVLINDEKAPENLSPAEEEAVREKEGERILKALKGGEFVILTDISGSKLSSLEFSEFISKKAVDGTGSFAFVIGGSLGVSDNVRARADFRLSFSDMTFPHQLMRVILLEQVYRAFRIINNEPYHK